MALHGVDFGVMIGPVGEVEVFAKGESLTKQHTDAALVDMGKGEMPSVVIYVAQYLIVNDSFHVG